MSPSIFGFHLFACIFIVNQHFSDHERHIEIQEIVLAAAVDDDLVVVGGEDRWIERERAKVG